MKTLTVWKFDSSTGATEALSKLGQVQKQQLIEIVDAAIVEWPQGKKKPKTRQVNDLTAAGALNGAFWGMLFGMIVSFRSSVWPWACNGCFVRSFQ